MKLFQGADNLKIIYEIWKKEIFTSAIFSGLCLAILQVEDIAVTKLSEVMWVDAICSINELKLLIASDCNWRQEIKESRPISSKLICWLDVLGVSLN